MVYISELKFRFDREWSTNSFWDNQAAVEQQSMHMHV